MATLTYGLNVSLDGNADHRWGAPAPGLFRHFIEQVRGATAMVCGRRMYEVMRYWDVDDSGWDAAECEFAAVWRSRPKWVASRTPTPPSLPGTSCLPSAG